MFAAMDPIAEPRAESVANSVPSGLFFTVTEVMAFVPPVFLIMMQRLFAPLVSMSTSALPPALIVPDVSTFDVVPCMVRACSVGLSIYVEKQEEAGGGEELVE